MSQLFMKKILKLEEKNEELEIANEQEISKLRK